jgi:hypothetical protein
VGVADSNRDADQVVLLRDCPPGRSSSSADVSAPRLGYDELTKLWDISQVQVLAPLEWINAPSTVQRSVENVTSLIRVEFGLPSLDVGLYPARHSPEAFRVPKR